MATIRWFGGAAEAAGSDTTPVAVGTTLGAALDAAVSAHPTLAAVLPRCSLLLDGIRVTDRALPLGEGTTLDVLPPFAGG